MSALYATEKENILKTTPLTYASVYPSKLQLQNVQHVLNVFNEKVVVALRLMKKNDTVDFIDQLLTWWKIQNVSSKGQDARMRDPNRAVQTKDSTNLQPYLDLFTNAQSGEFLTCENPFIVSLVFFCRKISNNIKFNPNPYYHFICE